MQLVIYLPLAPMKLKNVKTQKLNKRGRTAAFLVSLCLLTCIGLVGEAAQLRAQKRITSVWTATGAEGSRVTVSSDAQLNDCEGYTRGDRFYVKIPKSDLPSTTGSLLGRGFDDVQIQRSGDGIILSFHLQPGTTARIDQKLNRIEIVFSTPTRTTNAGSRTDSNDVANRTRARTIRDTAGPTPSHPRENSTGPSASERRSSVRNPGAPRVGSKSNLRPDSESRHNSTKGSTSGSSRQKTSGEKSGVSSAGNAGSTSSAKQPTPPTPKEAPSPSVSSGNKESSAKSTAPAASPLPSASPVSSASPTTSASSSAAGASPSGTPATVAIPASQQTTSSASPTPVAAGTSDWSSRLHWYKTWVQLNPLPVAIAGLIFLALLLLLFVRGGRKRRSAVAMYKEQKPAGATKETSAAPVRSTPEPAVTPPAGAVAGRARSEVPSEKSIKSPAARKAASEDPDREVFEL